LAQLLGETALAVKAFGFFSGGLGLLHTKWVTWLDNMNADENQPSLPLFRENLETLISPAIQKRVSEKVAGESKKLEKSRGSFLSSGRKL